jgi:hypothetical protein
MCPNCNKTCSKKFCSISCYNNYQHTKAKEKYNLNPKQCKKCSKIIPFDNKDNIFCNSSCSASFNNVEKVRDKERTIRYHGVERKYNIKCFICDFPTKNGRKYCSKKCSGLATKMKTILMMENGLVAKRVTLKNILIRQRGYKCEECQGTEWKNQPIPLELDHIDGNATNNFPSNLRILCPNCHAQTPTYCAKNIGNGRKTHGLRQS